MLKPKTYFATLLLLLAACTETTPGNKACIPGQTNDCKCSADKEGVQVCDRAGAGFEPCECGGGDDGTDSTDKPDAIAPDVTTADTATGDDSTDPQDNGGATLDTEPTDSDKPDAGPPPECEEDSDCPPDAPLCTPQGVCLYCYPETLTCDGEVSMLCLPDGSGYELSEDCGAIGSICNDVGVCQSPCGGFGKLAGTNAGCEFWAVDLRNAIVSTPAKYLDAQNSPFVVVVANTDETGAAEVTVTSPDGTIQKSAVPPSGLVTFPIAEDFGLKGSGRTNNGIHIVASKPVVAFQFNPYANVDVFSNDASTLLPADAQGGEYRVVTLAHQKLGGNDPFPGYVVVVGAGEGPVEATITVTGSTTGGDDIPALNTGMSHTFTVSPGEVVAFESKSGDLTGTRVMAAGRVMVFAGHVAARPGSLSVCCSDHLEQQIPPVTAWGTEYALARSWERANEPDYLRIVASKDGTQVTIDGGVPQVISLQAGAFHEMTISSHVHITATQPVLVAQILASAEESVTVGPCNTPADCGGNAYKCEPFSSSSAVNVCQLKSCSTTAECGPGFSCAASLYGEPGKSCKAVGDPAMMLAVPTSRWQERFVFVAPDKYLHDYVNIVAESGTVVSLDGVEIAEWESIGGGFVAHRTPVSDGVHVVDSSAPATVTVYGYDDHVSYGYPGGARLK